MTERVIVAIDGRPASASALDWAIHRGKTVPVQLELVTVVDLTWVSDDETPSYVEACERALVEAGARVVAAGSSVPWTTSLVRDRHVPGLLAATERADLLVIGSDKAGALSGVVHGTLPLAVAGRTRVPLVVVPIGWSPTPGSVLVGIDDEVGRSAAEFAAIEAARAGVDVLAVRGWELPPLLTVRYDLSESPTRDLERASGAMLDAAVSTLRREHHALTVTGVLEHGRPSVLLLEHSRHARLAVVGSHGRGAVAGLLLGSVGHDLLMNMTCPVAVVPERPRRSTSL